MVSRDQESGIERVVELIKEHRSYVALTGAGLSTRSGIPDFRSPGVGLWDRIENIPDDQVKLMTLHGFAQNPGAFYKRFRILLEIILSAEPNRAHFALSTLEAKGYLQGIITQNGDMLHQKAGSQKVNEIHGTIARATCLSCYQSDEGLSYWRKLLAEGTVPQCRHCGGVMKPDVILTGEQLPRQKVLQAKKLLQTCDLILAAGTSFAGGILMTWVEAACAQGKKLIIMNLSPTILDSLADVVLQADVVEAFPAIVGELNLSMTPVTGQTGNPQ
jgi:NAD-dependent deacetylase